MARVIAQITTRYATVEGSNVGKYVGNGLGRQRTVRSDQGLSSQANHREVAERVAMAILDRIGASFDDHVVLDEVDSNDAGTQRRWYLTRLDA